MGILRLGWQGVEVLMSADDEPKTLLSHSSWWWFSVSAI